MKAKRLLTSAALIASALFLQGCGSSDDPPDVAASLIGVFLDSPVGNINYKTATKEGVTDADGKYEYVAGETVTFSIGTLTFPPVAAAETVTPLDIAGTTDPNDQEALNMIRLLQTLDADGDPNNGITITETAKGAASPVDFTASETDFANAVAPLLQANADDTETESSATLVSAEAAVAHFEDTLADSGVTSNTLKGSWRLSSVNGTADDSVVFNFLPDGRFVALQWEEENDFTGYEYGTYSAGEGRIRFITLRNQDGEALTCDEPQGSTCNGATDESSVWEYAFSDQGALNITTYDTNNVVFNKIAATDSPIDGLWEHRDDGGFVHFMNGSATGSGEYYYVNYESGNEYEVGTYSTVVNNGNTEINLAAGQSSDGDTNPFSVPYSVINQQLAIINEDGSDTSRAYFDLVFADDGAPANTAKLIAQKQYDADILANQNYGLAINREYRTQIETASSSDSASTVSAKFTIDEMSNLVKGDLTDGSASLQTRLYAIYAYPGNEAREHGLYLSVSLRLRNYGGEASASYVLSTCFDGGCNNEVYLNETVQSLGDYNGDHTMEISWDATTESFAFLVDGSEAGRLSLSDYNAAAADFSSTNTAAGNYIFDPSHYHVALVRSEVRDVRNEGESGYNVVHMDEFSIDGEVYDDFTAGRIDPSKWEYFASEGGGNRISSTPVTQANLDYLIGKELSLDGNFIVLRSDSTFDGTWEGEPIAATWEIKDGYFCRTLTEFHNAAATGSEDCQLWNVTESSITGTRDKGNGVSFVYTIGSE